jgi:hypothetical protein
MPSQHNSSCARDQFSGADTFTQHRDLIEKAASDKYDAEGTNPADGSHDGSRVLIVRDADIPN